VLPLLASPIMPISILISPTHVFFSSGEVIEDLSF
ncbi:unnamed protein product, partial [marine sediment metagenome]